MFNNTSKYGGATALAEINALTKFYAVRHPFGRHSRQVTAVDNAQLEILTGETMGIVGGSGSGKSTLARCIAGLEAPSRGSIRFAGHDVQALKGDERRCFHQHVQLVLQDSAAALNPRYTAAEIIAEPLCICRRGTKEERYACCLDLMRQLDLPVLLADRRPQQLSGGQRQRLAIARAIVLKPTLLILDEVLTGLDVPVQKQIIDLLRRLHRQYSLTYLFISHDLRLVRAITDRVAVMHAGRIVEQGTTREIFTNPQHAHTRDLLNAVTGPGNFESAAAGGRPT